MLRVFGREVRHDVLDDAVHVVPVSRNGVLGETVKVGGIKHIPAILKTRNESHSGCWNATFDATDLDFVKPSGHNVGKPKEDQTISPFRDKFVVSELAGHDWGMKREGGRGLNRPFCLPTLMRTGKVGRS